MLWNKRGEGEGIERGAEDKCLERWGATYISTSSRLTAVLSRAGLPRFSTATGPAPRSVSVVVEVVSCDVWLPHKGDQSGV